MHIVYGFLDVIEPFDVGTDVIMPYVVALMLLCIICRTFDIGTDVNMPMCSCTDVTVQDIYLGS